MAPEFSVALGFKFLWISVAAEKLFELKTFLLELFVLGSFGVSKPKAIPHWELEGRKENSQFSFFQVCSVNNSCPTLG